MRNKTAIKAICPEYQKLLREAQVALSNWTKGRAEPHRIAGKHPWNGRLQQF